MTLLLSLLLVRRVGISPGSDRDSGARSRTPGQVGSAVERSWAEHSSRLGLQTGHVLEHVGCVLEDVVAEDHHPAGHRRFSGGSARPLEDEPRAGAVSYTHLRAHETPEHL